MSTSRKVFAQLSELHIIAQYTKFMVMQCQLRSVEQVVRRSSNCLPWRLLYSELNSGKPSLLWWSDETFFRPRQASAEEMPDAARSAQRHLPLIDVDVWCAQSSMHQQSPILNYLAQRHRWSQQTPTSKQAMLARILRTEQEPCCRKKATPCLSQQPVKSKRDHITMSLTVIGCRICPIMF